MTREEAIKQVRAVLENLKSNLSGLALEKATSEAFETLIPELKETNDERIIKKLQEYVKNRNWALNGPTQAEVLDWLEKQKEQDECPEYCVRSHCMGCSIYEKKKEQIPYTDFVIKPHKGDDNNPYDMSASEAQEYVIKRGFSIPFIDGEVYVDERHVIQTIGNILRWADEHPKEQKPAWSEEDERKVSALLAMLTTMRQLNSSDSLVGIYNKMDREKKFDEIENWLKSLRPQQQGTYKRNV